MNWRVKNEVQQIKNPNNNRNNKFDTICYKPYFSSCKGNRRDYVGNYGIRNVRDNYRYRTGGIKNDKQYIKNQIVIIM